MILTSLPPRENLLNLLFNSFLTYKRTISRAFFSHNIKIGRSVIRRSRLYDGYHLFVGQVPGVPLIFGVALPVPFHLNLFPKVFFQVVCNGDASVLVGGLDHPFRPYGKSQVRPVIVAFFQFLPGILQLVLPRAMPE